MSNRKKRQHHVWKTYLKAWEVDGTVSCLMDGRPFETDPINLAVEGGFYKLVKLDAKDVDLIRRFVIDTATHPSAKRNHEDLLRRLVEPARFVEANRQYIANIKEVEAKLDMFQTNALEDLHQGIESRFQSLLERIHNEDLSFYYDDILVIDFLHYICSQHMRTKGLKAEAISSLQARTGLDLTRTWDVMCQMFSANIGASLYRERRDRKLVLVRNHTEVDFITGDQPTLNLRGGHRMSVKTLVFYYPISPTLALILTETDGKVPFTTEGLTSDQVRYLNARVAKAAYRQIYGLLEATLLQAQADAAV